MTFAKTANLRTNPNNPRAIRKDQLNKLVKSLQEFPEMLEARPIVIDKEGTVLGGNMRLKAAQLAGLDEVPVYVREWDEDKDGQFIIKDNVSFGEWDWDALGNEWDPGQLNQWGLDTWQPDIDEEDLSDDFKLTQQEKEPYQNMTFRVHDDQAETIKKAVALCGGALTLEEKYVFTQWLKNQGVKAKQINEATGSFMGSHYVTDKSQPDVPTVEKWEKFRHLVKVSVPQHIEDLINRHTIAEHQNDNANSNALTDICQAYLEQNGNG